MADRPYWTCRNCGSKIYLDSNCNCGGNSVRGLVIPEKEKEHVTIMGFRDLTVKEEI